jgi:head-tail adaptor
MRIGHNREKIKIVSFNSTRDAGGGWSIEGGTQFTDNYTENFGSQSSQVYWDTNAAVENVKDKYRAETYEVSIEEAIVFSFRNRSDKVVTKFMRVLFRDKYYTIHGIDSVGYRGGELRLTCKVKE